jgi:hypothetical protein
MRHLGSLVLSVISAALIYVLAGVAASKWTEGALAKGSTDKYTALTVCVVAAVVAGGLYALLMLARLSPLGLVIAGLALGGVALWAFFNPSNFSSVMPDDLAGVKDAGVAAAGPFTLVLSVPLLLTVFSGRRWRRWSDAPAGVAPAPNYSPPPVSPAGYGASSFNAPSYPAPSAPEPAYAPPPTYTPAAPMYNSPVSPAFAPPPPAAGSRSAAGGGISFPPIPPPSPYNGPGDEPETTRRL